MIISAGFDTTAVTGGTPDNPSHPLGPNHVNSAGVSVRSQSSDGQLHMNNASFGSNTGTIGLNLAKGPMVCYQPVVFTHDPSILPPATSIWFTIERMGNMQGSNGGPHPVLDILDRMFGIFGSASLREIALTGGLTYPVFQQHMFAHWPAFVQRHKEATTLGSTTALAILPWRDPFTTLHDPFYAVSQFHGIQTHGSTDHFEFGIFLNEAGILTESARATDVLNRGQGHLLNTLCSTSVLSNHWVGTTTGRGPAASGVTESTQQEQTYFGSCQHVHPLTEVLEPEPDVLKVLYIPMVLQTSAGISTGNWQPSTDPVHWTADFMSGKHRNLSSLRLRPADPSKDYWLAQRSFTTHNVSSISFKSGTRSGGDAVPFVQTTFAQANSSSTREITWSMFSNTSSVLCEVQRGTVPAQYQITPIFVAKDMIHLTVADNSASGVGVGYDTVLTCTYPQGRSLKSNNTHTVDLSVILNGTFYVVTLIFCLGPRNGGNIIEIADVAGTALINYRAATQSSRDTLSGTGSLPYGTQCAISYGWLTRERAAHKTPEILLTLK